MSGRTWGDPSVLEKTTPVGADFFLMQDSAAGSELNPKKVFYTNALKLSAKGDILSFDTNMARLPVGGDGQFLRANSATATGLEWDSPTTDDIPEGSNLYFTDARAITALQKTNEAVGWTMTGGTSPATLTLTASSTIDQNLSSTSSVLFGHVRASFDPGISWISGDFGDDTTGDRVVMGTLDGYASLGAHNSNLTAWADFVITPGAIISGANTGLGLFISAGQTPNATFHSAGSTILGAATSAVVDSLIYNNQVNFWYDEGNSQLVFKAKDSGGTVTSFALQAGGTTDSKWDIPTAGTLRPKQSQSTSTLVLEDSSQAQNLSISMTTLSGPTFSSSLGDFFFNKAITVESISPPTAPLSGTKLYTDSGDLYSLSSGAQKLSLTRAVVKVITAPSYTIQPGDDIIVIDTISNNVDIVVDSTKISGKVINIVWVDGGNTATYTPEAGQFINGSAASRTFLTQFSSADISVITPGVSGSMYTRQYTTG